MVTHPLTDTLLIKLQSFKYISLLNSLPPNSFERYPKIYLYSEIIQKSSSYGPICFITPEIGRWS